VVEGQNFEIRRTLFRYSSIIEEQRKQLMTRRDQVLEGRATPRLAQIAPARWDQVSAQHGEGVALQVEAQIELALQDRLWADHLTEVADIREGIHLHALSGGGPFAVGTDPQLAFSRLVVQAFDARWESLEADLAQAFVDVDIGPDGADLGPAGLQAPAATWTYIINDDPFEAAMSRAMRGLVQKLRD